MRVLCLGGSNTVLKDGHADHLRSLFERYAQDELMEFRNSAVGANSVFHGLQIALDMKDLQQFDVIFLEYCVNDYTYVDDQNRRSWTYAIEGLLRTLLQRCPAAKIFFVNFGRAIWVDSKRNQLRMYTRIANLVEHYRSDHCVHVVEIDDYLRALSGGQKDIFFSFYQDETHYATPVVSALIANVVFSSYLQTLISDSTSKTSLEKRNFFKGSFASLQAIPMCSLVQDQEITVFKNSRYRIEGLRIDGGRTVEFVAPGGIVSLGFISAPGAGSMIVEEEGALPVLIDCRHGAVDTGRFPFFIKNFPFSWKRWNNKADVVPRKVRIQVLRSGEQPVGRVRYPKRFGMLPGASTEQATVYLSSATFCESLAADEYK